MTSITKEFRKSQITPPEPPAFNSCQSAPLTIYPVTNYTFSVKEASHEEDPSVQTRLQRLRIHYKETGMRRSQEAVLLAHENGHPYILMLQIGNAFYKLPGDYLRPGIDEEEGLAQHLSDTFGPEPGSEGSEDGQNYDWNIQHCLSQWWRPNFDPFLYPFLPPHITRPKECRKQYLFQLPKHQVFAVPRNMKMIAVPLFELYDNSSRYGSQSASLPLQLSRYNFEFVDKDGNVMARTPGSLENGEQN